MQHPVSRLALIAAVSTLACPAAAADWTFGNELRGAYAVEPKDSTEAGDPYDTLQFEAGVRYWYSLGAQTHTVGESDFTSTDAAHLGEVHLRIDDLQTRTYIKGIAGYSGAINGTFSDPDVPNGTVADGRVGYAGGDFGWNAFGDENAGVGAFVGYQYWNDSPRTGRAAYATVGSAGDVAYNADTGRWGVGADSVDGNVDVNMLRLGLSGRARLNEMFDVTAEVAAVPYAHIGGVIGGHQAGDKAFSNLSGCDLPPDPCVDKLFKTTPTSISGWGYGAMGEIWAGVHPTENLTFRVGARAWYLTGTYDATFNMAEVTPPQRRPDIDDPTSDDPLDMIPPTPLYGPPTVRVDDYIDRANPFSMLRYGIMAELTYRF